MPHSFREELNHANKLMREGKFEESVKIINDLEKGSTLTPSDRLSLLILKGKIYTLSQQYGASVKVGRRAYRLSQNLGRLNETITSLLLKANCIYLGGFNKGLNYLSKAENLLNSLKNISPSNLSRQRANILFRKAWAFFFLGKTKIAIEIALRCLPLQEKLDRKREIAYTFQLLGDSYSVNGDYDIAYDYAMNSMELFKELNDNTGFATSLRLLGRIKYHKGDLDQGLKFLKESFSSISASPQTKLDSLLFLGQIYSTKGEIDKALKYFRQGYTLAKNEKSYFHSTLFHVFIGSIYIMKKEFDLAIEYLKSGLFIAEKLNNALVISLSIFLLIMTYTEMNSLEKAQKYLKRFKKYSFEKESNLLKNGYLLLKAYLLKKRGGSSRRGEAERLLKQVINEESDPFFKAYALIYLCEFYIEELHLFEDLNILKKIEPIIVSLFKFSEEQHMYGYLAETKLLQAKVAMIQMNFGKAQKLLTQAQHIADLYGINITAQRISNEHDKLLEQLKEWEKLKKKNASIAERLKLASIEGVLERLQGKRVVKPPELIDEEPILLIIMNRSGISYFNYSFRENWDSTWLFSSFMSAFDTFSFEIFSESIDRIKIGEHIILINPIESFLVCYVIKGQSYLGLKKLNRFSNAIKNNVEIWDSLNRAVETGEELELDKPPSLRVVMNEIFNQ